MAADPLHPAAPNLPNVLDSSGTGELGFDTATPLNKQSMPSLWKRFLEIWPRAPTFVGRYFGRPDFPTKKYWVPGELNGLLAKVPDASSLGYVAAFSEAGQWRVQGRSTKTGPVEADSRVRQNGRDDGMDAGRAIRSALEYHVNSIPELLAPSAGRMFVFLDVEWQKTLHPYYWLGWAEAIGEFDAGTQLLPALYNLRNYAGAVFLPDTLAHAEHGFTPTAEWDQAKHRCHGVMALAMKDRPRFSDALGITQRRIANRWPTFDTLRQPSGAPAPVVLWQYQINIEMTAAGVLREGSDITAGDAVLEIDIDMTNPNGHDGRPVTDFMLRRNAALPGDTGSGFDADALV